MTRMFSRTVSWLNSVRKVGRLASYCFENSPHLQLLVWYAHVFKVYVSSSWSWSSKFKWCSHNSEIFLLLNFVVLNIVLLCRVYFSRMLSGSFIKGTFPFHGFMNCQKQTMFATECSLPLCSKVSQFFQLQSLSIPRYLYSCPSSIHLSNHVFLCVRFYTLWQFCFIFVV